MVRGPQKTCCRWKSDASVPAESLARGWEPNAAVSTGAAVRSGWKPDAPISIQVTVAECRCAGSRREPNASVSAKPFICDGLKLNSQQRRIVAILLAIVFRVCYDAPLKQI
jgi:hypothetical protein